MRYATSPRVEQDLLEIADFIAKHNPRRALTYVREMRAEFRQIAKLPDAYTGHPLLPRHLRRAVFGEYWIVFSVGESGVLIRRVIHGARDMGRASF